uniref:Uncharacterized protein n=1 Tax=Cyanothece sp. (strain PCC 7425 / ATCC 29141) TaxID=395961 RepID=B8HK14_CYAP4
MVRRITIRLVPKDAQDSPDILAQVARAFPEADEVEIDMTALSFDDSTLQSEVVGVAVDALEQQERRIQSGDTTIEPLEEALDKNKNWYETLLNEGIKATIQAVVREIVQNLMERGIHF